MLGSELLVAGGSESGSGLDRGRSFWMRWDGWFCFFKTFVSWVLLARYFIERGR